MHIYHIVRSEEDGYDALFEMVVVAPSPEAALGYCKAAAGAEGPDEWVWDKVTIFAIGDAYGTTTDGVVCRDSHRY